MKYNDYGEFCHAFDMKLGEFIRWLTALECPDDCPDDGSGNYEAFFEMAKGEYEYAFIKLREEAKGRFKEYFKE